MNKNIVSKLCIGSLIAVAILGGCASKVNQKDSKSLEKISNFEIEQNQPMKQLSDKALHIEKKNVYLSTKMGLSQALLNLSKALYKPTSAGIYCDNSSNFDIFWHSNFPDWSCCRVCCSYF